MWKKWNIFKLMLAACLIVTNVSCREDCDDVVSYAYNDMLNFAEANSSLEGQFKAIWTAMNCNYPIWDYEEQNGLNWDDVYDNYISQVKELDKKYNVQNPVPDSLVSQLYKDMFSSLHDGHLSMYLKNIHTGNKIPSVIAPQITRFVEDNIDSLSTVLELYYLLTSFKPTLKYYERNNEIEEMVEEEDFIFSRFKDGIAYLRIPIFSLTQAFLKREVDEKEDRICKLWESWYDCIQRLCSEGSLKGIIIDVRNNPGGTSNDYQYVLGALHYGNETYGSQRHQIGYLREKSGIGRHDFSRLQPFTLPIYEKEHKAIESPIVVLSNVISASMAEITCLAAKQLKNGYVIGTKTYGALSPSLDNSYSITYSGNVGDPALAGDEKTSYFAPFFIDIPTSAFLSLDNQVIDGTGIVPNEIVHIDWKSHMLLDEDAQLNRALEYIREK